MTSGSTLAPPRSRARRTPPPSPPPSGRKPPRGPAKSLTVLHDRRARVAAIVILFVLSLLCARLVQIQGIDAREVAADARAGRLTPVTLLANRGEILDTNGVTLAQTVERRNIFVNQNLIAGKHTVGGITRQGLDSAVTDLSSALGVSETELRPKLTGTKGFNYIAKDVTPDVWRSVEALNIPGVGSEKTAARLYPAGVVAGNIIGYMAGNGDKANPKILGQAGIELLEQKNLAGTNGKMTYERGRTGQMIPTGVVQEEKAVDGSTVTLTIDRDLQWYAQQAITAQVAKVRGEYGVVIVMNPKTGDILALAESPTVNPNDPSATSADDRGSHALSNVFEPGSTAKLITAAGALEEGLVTPESRFVVKDKYVATNGERFKDSHGHAPEKLTFAGILAQSSNVGTLMVGSQMSKDTRYKYLSAFGLGQPTGLKFPGQSRGILHKVKDWDGRTGLAVLFGQGVSSTALQAVMPFATIANDGIRMQPRLVASVTSPTGEVTKTPIITAQRVVSDQTAIKVRQMLAGVLVEGGTGQRAAIPGYQIAGKTGTSQAPKDGGYSGYTGSFIGMAPADSPELVVGVIIQRPQNGYYGGTVAGPVFKDVMSFALKQRGILPSATPYPLLPTKY